MSARIMTLRRPDPRNEIEAFNVQDEIEAEAADAEDWERTLDALGCPPCNQDCNQGRTCPTRQACEVSDFEPLGIREERWVTRIALVIAVGVLLFLAAERFGMLPKWLLP